MFAASTLLALSACDGCSGDKPGEAKQDMAPKVKEDMAPEAEPDVPEEDPLKEAREKAEEEAELVAVGRADAARLAAADIESASKKDDDGAKKTNIKRPPKFTGAIDAKDASKVFRKFEGAMKKCYERALKKQPGLEGKVTLTVVIDTDGSVKRASARGRTLNSKLVTNCMESLAKRMKFPKPKGGAAQLKKPYVFKPDL